MDMMVHLTAVDDACLRVTVCPRAVPDPFVFLNGWNLADQVKALLKQEAQKGDPVDTDSGGPPPTAPIAQMTQPSGAGDALPPAEIHDLPGQQEDPAPGAQPAAAVDEAAGAPMADPGEVTDGDVEYLLNQAQAAIESIHSESPGDPPPGLSKFQLQEFAGAPATTESATLDLISDVELDLKIELGRTLLRLEDVLRLRKGSVVPLDKLAGDPVDIYVNGRMIARGEVLVMNDNFCVRVTELIAGVTPT